MKNSILTLAAICILGQSLLAQETQYQMARFDAALTTLETLMTSDRDINKVVDQLIDSGEARIAAFNLQALGKIYSDESDLFSNLRKDFKEIEDGIGTIDKWADLKNKSKESKARADFAKQLEKNKWSVQGRSPKLTSIRSQLTSYNWPSIREDQQLILSQLAGDLDKIKSTSFDLGQLEEGDGLHEFRREVRWFTIKARVLNGLFKFKSGTACPLPELRRLLREPIATSKYATLPSSRNESKPCEITQCLFVDMASVVEQMGKIKDEVEQKIGNSNSDVTPADLKIKAEAVYDAFKSRDTLSRLAGEIQSCKP